MYFNSLLARYTKCIKWPQLFTMDLMHKWYKLWYMVESHFEYLLNGKNPSLNKTFTSAKSSLCLGPLLLTWINLNHIKDK